MCDNKTKTKCEEKKSVTAHACALSLYHIDGGCGGGPTIGHRINKYKQIICVIENDAWTDFKAKLCRLSVNHILDELQWKMIINTKPWWFIFLCRASTRTNQCFIDGKFELMNKIIWVRLKVKIVTSTTTPKDITNNINWYSGINKICLPRTSNNLNRLILYIYEIHFYMIKIIIIIFFYTTEKNGASARIAVHNSTVEHTLMWS